MSTNAEKIRAQEMALSHKPPQPWSRHIAGPKELERLLADSAENQQRGLILATLHDMVLGEAAIDRSEDALLRGVRALICPAIEPKSDARQGRAAEAETEAVTTTKRTEPGNGEPMHEPLLRETFDVRQRRECERCGKIQDEYVT